MRVAGVSTLAGGALLGFLSLGFGLSAKQAEEDFQAAKRNGPFDLAYQYQQDAQSRAQWANIFLAIGGAALATGAVLVLWPRGDDRPTARVVPAGLGATLAMEF
jgi:hypothetical protein